MIGHQTNASGAAGMGIECANGLDIDVTAKTLKEATVQANRNAAAYYGDVPHRIVAHYATVTSATYSDPAAAYRVSFRYETEGKP